MKVMITEYIRPNYLEVTTKHHLVRNFISEEHLYTNPIFGFASSKEPSGDK
jgi:hypothetical protein